jgi:hypothetical protein
MGTTMTLSEMFTDQDIRTFEQRRDRVVSIVQEATNLMGADQDLRWFVDSVSTARSETEFEAAFDVLMSAISDSRLQPVPAPASRR